MSSLPVWSTEEPPAMAVVPGRQEASTACVVLSASATSVRWTVTWASTSRRPGTRSPSPSDPSTTSAEPTLSAAVSLWPTAFAASSPAPIALSPMSELPRVPSATSPPATAFARSSEAPTAFRATSAAFTAFLLICAAPTLFFDSLTAAYELPPSATNSAASATTIAGLGRLRRTWASNVTPSFGESGYGPTVCL
jgi:hypothetical protein